MTRSLVSMSDIDPRLSWVPVPAVERLIAANLPDDQDNEQCEGVKPDGIADNDGGAATSFPPDSANMPEIACSGARADPQRCADTVRPPQRRSAARTRGSCDQQRRSRERRSVTSGWLEQLEVDLGGGVEADHSPRPLSYAVD
jgi:hypothetical protein